MNTRGANGATTEVLVWVVGKGIYLLIDMYAVRYLYVRKYGGVGGVIYLLIEMYAISYCLYLERDQTPMFFYSVCRMQLRSVTSD